MAYHADMNFTMMRNWVGQIGDKELYEACDRHGIMIWQDFWLANPSDGPDPYDPEMFIANAEDYVKRFRNHASIGIYCGRNEGFPPEQIDKALRRIVKEDHPGLHYISSSADEVVSGHGPYRALPVKEYFSLKNGSDKFHSERGMPNVMITRAWFVLSLRKRFGRKTLNGDNTIIRWKAPSLALLSTLSSKRASVSRTTPKDSPIWLSGNKL